MNSFKCSSQGSKCNDAPRDSTDDCAAGFTQEIKKPLRFSVADVDAKKKLNSIFN